MRSLRIRLTGFLVVAAVCLGGPVAALAGSGGSASNSQYVDPLASLPKPKTVTHTTTTSTAPATITPAAAPASPAPVVSSSASATAATATAATATATTDPSKTLPYTGYPLWETAAFGVALAAAGTALRRRAN